MKQKKEFLLEVDIVSLPEDLFQGQMKIQRQRIGWDKKHSDWLADWNYHKAFLPIPPEALKYARLAHYASRFFSVFEGWNKS